MDKITMLGTGHAMTSECFNTCFIYENEIGKMLVDTGGGQRLVARLRSAKTAPEDISLVFLSHRHTDHILGLPWLLRMRIGSLSTQPLTILAHKELCEAAEAMILLLFPEAGKHIGKSLFFIGLENNQSLNILGRETCFYDTFSDNAKQYGFILTLSDGQKFVFNGDVPYNKANSCIISGAEWLMHEAFCTESERSRPLRGHSSVLQAAKYAAELEARNLILVHGSDLDILNRKIKYAEEAAAHFKGNIFVPDDLDIIEL